MPRPRDFAIAATAAAFANAISVTVAPAQAMEFAAGGQVNRILLLADDGEQTRHIHADNVNSQTRLRLTARHAFDEVLKAGWIWESGYTHNPSSRISMNAPSVAPTLNKRHADLHLATRWGKLSLGRGDGAANGGMESDLSGTTVVQYSSITDVGGSFVFRPLLAGSGAGGPTIAATIGNLDFESRYPRLRFDTPRLASMNLALSEGRKDNRRVTELAVRHDDDAALGKLSAALGWSRKRPASLAGDEHTIGGSASWLAPSGLNLTFALGVNRNDDPTRPQRAFRYAKAGYLAGRHALSFDSAEGRDFKRYGDRSRAAGVGYVFAPTPALELFAGVKRHRLEHADARYRPIDFAIAGFRYRF